MDPSSGFSDGGRQGLQSTNNPAYVSRGYTILPYQSTQERFACPFHKLDPAKHQSCEHYNLTNWYHTHQHLGRVHALGMDLNHAAYCAICRIPFKGKNAEAEWQHHLRAGQCMHASMEETGQLLPAEFVKLARLGTGLSSEQRWYAAWEKLFPLLAKPDSAYFESHVDLLRRHAQGRMQLFLGHGNLALINRLVDEIFTPPVIPRMASVSSVPGPGVSVSLSPASGSTHINDWLASESLMASPAPVSDAFYTPGFAQGAVMTSPFGFPMQPILPGPFQEASSVLDFDNLQVNHDGAFFESPARQLGEDWDL
ncbi:hypothetical protein HYE67_002800 [Fusarium culmorum]|uniref:Uncharacterized protein n=1 Tax=Fusarium culmorum TaxID=5516 RepID=A0A7S8D231_FUSCU|nr:hypothetical protein HYE67_002800 [Fusarium culmorum]